MLNAFRRHRLGHRDSALATRARATCAQRLSASQTWSLHWSRNRSARPRCAQRLSASQTWSPAAMAKDAALHATCSTPFGVTDLVTLVKTTVFVPESRCSTPFGVTDLVTPAVLLVGLAVPGCSTPFGVTDLVTPIPLLDVAGIHECSTPFGVTDLVTRSASCLSACEEGVLNAFRRHRLGHCRLEAGVNPRSLCSTPFGVTDLVTRGFQGRGVGIRLVLNAFRRHRLGHLPSAVHAFEAEMCSTPFGVTDLVTRTDPAGRRRTGRAQRLSASQTWSRRQRGYLPIHARCSTPFGVTDLVTVPEAVNTETAGVCSTPFGVTDLVTSDGRMEATSSVECSTPFGVTDLVTSRLLRRSQAVHCAQRLSASQTWSPARPCEGGYWPQCAQRLSASQTWSPGCGEAERSLRVVLNAFRRHRLGHTSARRKSGRPRPCSTPFGVTDLVTCRTPNRSNCKIHVLNAFRRHRLGHSRRSPTQRGEWMVLNAFRRHRLGHAGGRSRPPDQPCRRCSTPFGVTDLVTLHSMLRFRRLLPVLNAFRRHRLGHPMCYCCACQCLPVLNAFRRHRLGHTKRRP